VSGRHRYFFVRQPRLKAEAVQAGGRREHRRGRGLGNGLQVGRSSAQAAPKLDVGDYQAILNAMAA
jgi:hypothetical protein